MIPRPFVMESDPVAHGSRDPSRSFPDRTCSTNMVASCLSFLRDSEAFDIPISSLFLRHTSISESSVWIEMTGDTFKGTATDMSLIISSDDGSGFDRRSHVLSSRYPHHEIQSCSHAQIHDAHLCQVYRRGSVHVLRAERQRSTTLRETNVDGRHYAVLPHGAVYRHCIAIPGSNFL